MVAFRGLSLSGAALVCAVGCSASPEFEPAPIATAASPVIGGTADTEHEAVVMLTNFDFLGSGTVIAVEDGVGYILTNFIGEDATDVAVGDGSCWPASCDFRDVLGVTIHPEFDG